MRAPQQPPRALRRERASSSGAWRSRLCGLELERPSLEEQERGWRDEQERDRLADVRVDSCALDEGGEKGRVQPGDQEADGEVTGIGSPETVVAQTEGEVPVADVHDCIGKEVRRAGCDRVGRAGGVEG